MPAASSSHPTRRRPVRCASREWRNQAAAFRAYADTRDPEIGEHLIRAFLPVSASVARRYDHGRAPLEDIRQVAALGLIKAVDRFDPSRGVAFSSFAVPTISGEIRRYSRD